MKRRLALCLVLCAASVGPALAGEIRERTTFFMVRGKTFDELNRQLGMNGPDLGRGARHAGSTEVSFKSNVSYKNQPGGCGIRHAQVTLDLHTTLPRWASPANSSPDTRTLWKTLREDIATHEAEHSHIAKLWLKRIEAKLRTLPPERTCSAMEARVNESVRTLLKQHESEQIAFDAAESKRIDARLKRKLQENLSRVAKR